MNAIGSIESVIGSRSSYHDHADHITPDEVMELIDIKHRKPTLKEDIKENRKQIADAGKVLMRLRCALETSKAQLKTDAKVRREILKRVGKRRVAQQKMEQSMAVFHQAVGHAIKPEEALVKLHC